VNTPIRRVTTALLGLFGVLLLNANYLQVIRAEELQEDPRNSRVLVEEYRRQRGQIVVSGEAVATSVETDDRYRYLRRYPDGPLYAPVVGYYSLVYGRAGVERLYDDVLVGDDGSLFVRRIGDILSGREPRGGTVELTLDRALQQTAAQALAGRRGAVVALDPRTGAVRAMVTSPSYDPNALTSHDPAKIRTAYQKLTKDPRQPLVNRASQFTYPPGSVFKIVTAAAALESGRYRPDSVIDSPRELKLPLTNRTLKNFGGSSCGGDKIAFIEAFERSCNADFGAIGLTLGADRLRAQSEKFGLNATPDLGIAAAASRYPDEVDQPQTALTAIGQFDVRVTPLQMAMIAAGVANDGVVMRPHVVARTLSPDLEVLDATQPAEAGRAVSKPVADALTAMMTAVVNGANGTGSRAAIPGVTVAGKTGTAQQGEGRPPHAWFVGFAPAEAPTIAVAVVIEDGGDAGSEATGGRVAAPVARAVIERALAGRR
jgi:penicillin-binding protein A